MQRVVVIGAGIAGLSAARACASEAKQRGVEVEITVLEASGQVGGKAQTIRRDGWLLEAGPTGYLNNAEVAPLMDALARDGGLEAMTANAAAARRYLVRGTRLREIKAHPLRFATSGILGPIGFARLALEPFQKQRATNDDESVWDFAARRLGRQAADRLIAPMVLGVFAGDAKRTSLAAAFPRMVELEAQYGSLIKAMVALKKGGGGPSGELTSFARGLNELPTAIAAKAQTRGDFQVHCNTSVERIGRVGPASTAPAPDSKPSATWRIQVTQTVPSSSSLAPSIEADALVIATECFAAADLLSQVSPTAASELRAIPTPPVAVVGLGFGPAALACAPHGFGALVQRGGPLRILGALFDTHLFPGRSPEGNLLVRCIVGGATDPDLAVLPSEEILRLAHSDVCRLLNLEGAAAELSFHEVIHWPRAIPQFELGHKDRIARMLAALAAVPALHLAGNYLDGVAFAKAASSGHRAGLSALESLA